MNLHHLYVFCAVSKWKSFGKAANDINISQPAVSQQVKLLEDSLNKKLLERKGRNVSLTNYGELLFEYGVRIFHLVEEAQNSLTTMSKYQERLVIGTTIIPGSNLLFGVLMEFIQTHGHVHYDIALSQSNDELVDKLLKNQIDIAITYEGIILHDDIKTKKIVHDELVLVLPGKHPWADGQLLSLDQILTLPFIFSNRDFFVQQTLESILLGSKVNVVLQLPSFELVKSAILHGLGVSLLPLSSISLELEHGNLAIANCNVFRVPRHVMAMYKNNHTSSIMTKSFVDFLT